VQLSLAVDCVLRDVQHAFYGLCVNAGKQVLLAMMEADRAALCGARGVPDANRRATRDCHTAGAVALGGQRIGIKRPRRRAHAPLRRHAGRHGDLDVPGPPSA
jgi:putative transposase